MREKGRDSGRGLLAFLDPCRCMKSVARFFLVPGSTTAMATASTAAARATAAAATSSAPAATGPTAASATIATAVGTISGRTVCRSSSGDTRYRITIEVRFVVGEVSAAFDGQRGRTRRFIEAPLAAVRPRFSATHLGTLFFENGFA